MTRALVRSVVPDIKTNTKVHLFGKVNPEFFCTVHFPRTLDLLWTPFPNNIN
jgi:hypothetical protein